MKTLAFAIVIAGLCIGTGLSEINHKMTEHESNGFGWTLMVLFVFMVLCAALEK